jgi:surfeit locus 1 family protein
LALAGVLLTAYLGNWQLDRAAYKRELQQRLESAERQPPIRVSGQPVEAPTLAFRRVEAEGELVQEHTIFLDNRVHDGRVGYEVLTPLRLRDSAMHVLVNRGWVRGGPARSELPALRSVAGMVRIEGLALPPARRYLELGPQTVAGKVWQNLDLERYARAHALALQPIVIQQRNDLGDGLVRDWVPVDAGIDRHQAYALQWFVMSGAIFVTYVVLNVRRKR